ncbi:hypothetical protein LIER_30655 [Lithospermum erythrorhizon]|uniref:Replication factor A C-terminal domain-containing protein n=1 Tax=Lithospermum erythrorhizon TaxID=34254 RepID=A0AAV3RQD4_LITER
MPEIEGPALIEAANTLSVVIGKRLSLGTYHELATSLKIWPDFRLNQDELQELLTAQPLSISRGLIAEGDLKIRIIDEINSMTKYGEYWVRGFLQISEEDQKLYYIGCNNCNSKISASEEGIKYTCYACRKEVLTTARPLVFMSMRVILQTNASDLLRLMNMGQKYDLDTLRLDFQDSLSNDIATKFCPGKEIGVESSKSPLSPLKIQMS